MPPEPEKYDHINEINRQCYNHCADYWDRLPFKDFLPQEIVRIHNPVAGYRTLDIGSGTGMLAEWLVKNGFDLLCIDPSEEMILRCRNKGLQVEQCTIQKFIPRESFGLVVAVLSLIHVQKKEIAEQIDKIHKMLNPEGTFVLAVIEGHGEGISETEAKYPRYFSYYTRDEILQLTSGKFRLLSERSWSRDSSYLVFIFRKI